MTAICVDGSASYSESRSGTCSGHGGVDSWIGAPLPACNSQTVVSYKNQESAIQQSYDRLNLQLASTEASDEAYATEINTASIGNARAAAAAAGMSQASGSFGAPVAQAEAQLTHDLSIIKQRYAAQKAVNDSTAAVDISNVEIQIAKYKTTCSS